MKFCLYDERAQGCRIVTVKENFREALDAKQDRYVPQWVTILPLLTRSEFDSYGKSFRNEIESLYYLHYEIPGYPRKFGQVIVVPDLLPGITWTTGDRVIGIREKEGYVRRGVLLERDMKSGYYLFKSDYGSILQHKEHELFGKEFNPFHIGVKTADLMALLYVM